MNSDKLKNIPHSLEAEKAVLGCILIDNNSINDVLEHVTHLSFYKKAHRIIFESMLELYDKSTPIDSVNLIDRLKKNNVLEEVGGAYYITGLGQEAPSVSNAEHYSKIIKEKYVLRMIIKTSDEMSALAYEDNEVSEIVDRAEQHLFGISEITSKKKFQELEPMLGKVLEIWSNRKKGDITGVPSGFQDLDNQISGFQNSDLIVILTEWNEFRALDLKRLCKDMRTKYMADLRNVYSAIEVLNSGFQKYESVGRKIKTA